MNKQKFKDSLQYGICRGSGEFLSTKCRYDNPGQEIKNCPLNRVDPRETKCNCCNECRDYCGLKAQIKEVNLRERDKMMDEMLKVVDEYNAKK